VTNAALYARISSDPNNTSLGVQRQIKDCLALAKRKGWTVVEPYFVDNDVSATSGKPRPKYELMMDALAAGEYDALICWDVDRLTRKPRELEDVIDLAEKRGVQLASVGGEIDLATEQGRLTARIKGSVAKHEAEVISRRVKGKMAERAAAGAPHGPVPYGWRREPIMDDRGRRLGSRDVLHPEQAEIVRASIAAVLRGESLRALTARLNADGQVTTTGRPWTTTTRRGVLLRERNAGLRLHQGVVIGKGDWEPIIDEDTHARVVAVLTDPDRRTTPASSAVKYLLSGIARCGVCDGPMRTLNASTANGRTTDSYICQAAYHVRRPRLAVDDFVLGHLFALLSQPGAAALVADEEQDDVSEKRARAAELRQQMDDAARAQARGQIDLRQLTIITGELNPEWEALTRSVRAATSSADLADMAGPGIEQRWPTYALARQRALIQRLLDIKVDRLPYRGPAPKNAPLGVRVVERKQLSATT